MKTTLTKNVLTKLLRDFNVLGYSDINAKYIDNNKHGKILSLVSGIYRYEDEFYGGEPYCGNETIWCEEKPLFRCVYWGKVADGFDFNDIYSFLKMALKQGPSINGIHRGPLQFEANDLKYTNSSQGDIYEFKLTEKIFKNGQEIYTADFIGGLVDQ